MNAVNCVHLFIVVWTFTAVCRADDDLSSVNCENVTGTVGKVNFTCSVSQKCSECCISKYKFQYPKIYNDTEICRQEFPEGSCEQRNNFTCRYTPATAMTGQFRFFVQTIKCGKKNTEFTVDITEHQELKTEEDPGSEESPESNGESNGNVTTAVVGCSIITIIIIIMMTIIYKTQSYYSYPCDFQRRMFLCLRHDEDNSNLQQQSTQNEINSTDSTV
ncbi:uncharacterized protein LOC125261578 [Megalobrama amblycephala]|uniref:uncharacterized protein LOC125261578 n=1 Tax=Megalobrama amblycephala TaxID=75352 RepID=UPI002013EE45|nr:uncharacterized protein LOC125261578 [Megalobrama amblycephala]